MMDYSYVTLAYNDAEKYIREEINKSIYLSYEPCTYSGTNVIYFNFIQRTYEKESLFSKPMPVNRVVKKVPFIVSSEKNAKHANDVVTQGAYNISYNNGNRVNPDTANDLSLFLLRSYPISSDDVVKILKNLESTNDFDTYTGCLNELYKCINRGLYRYKAEQNRLSANDEFIRNFRNRHGH